MPSMLPGTARTARAGARRAAPGVGAALIAVAGLAGCGSERTPAPDLARPADPGGFARYRSPNGDIKLSGPRNWALTRGQPPSVITFSSGHAAVAIWAYPRVAVPETGAEAELAERLLVRSVRKRAPRFDVKQTRVTEVGGALAVELEGRGRIARRPVRVRSLHLYKGTGEYVVDAYAQPSQFRRADRQVFRRLMGGIRVGGDPSRIKANPSEREIPSLPPSFGGG